MYRTDPLHLHKLAELLAILLQDRRVAMRDAHQYVSAMKALENPVETRVIVFPNDSHALDSPQTEFEQWINAAWWLKRFI